jgi:hypothetical protein
MLSCWWSYSGLIYRTIILQKGFKWELCILCIHKSWKQPSINNHQWNHSIDRKEMEGIYCIGAITFRISSCLWCLWSKVPNHQPFPCALCNELTRDIGLVGRWLQLNIFHIFPAHIQRPEHIEYAMTATFNSHNESSDNMREKRLIRLPWKTLQ